YAYASGLVFALVIPLILSINLPVLAYTSGDTRWFWLAALVVSGYLLFTALSYMLLARERSFRRRFRVWLHSNVNS
ncbi:MAG: sodium:glutamate symporter, partial [Spirochaetota bacterium]